ncbi:MAG: NUDIX domain-containing protein [Candidatus Blackburnbacteria bacterium]|nr:NUDIX domain-containing protein [Candidatus Blackburnbacteria bacterium]
MAKARENKKPIKREFSAGGAVFRRRVPRASRVALVPRVAEIEWLLINPAGTNRWQLPKGHIEKGEKGEDAAVREVFEETGAKVKVLGKVDKIQYFYVLEGERIFKNVTFFLMESKDGISKVDKAWAHEINKFVGADAGLNKFVSDEIDKVCWLSTKAALGKLTFEGERKILEKASKML